MRRQLTTALTFGFFPMALLIMVLSLMTGRMELSAVTGVLLALVGGCVVLGIGVLVQSRSGVSRLSLTSRPRFLTVLACYGVGFALWFAAPFVMVAGGVGWAESVGSGRYRFAPWGLLVLVFVPVVAAAYGGAVVIRQRRREIRASANVPQSRES